MNDFDRAPGGIDDPGMKGGTEPEQRPLPPGDTAGDVAAQEPQASELDLPGPDDPVAWNYIKPGTEVVDPDDHVIGTVQAMLGTEDEGIFHGVAVDPRDGGPPRVLPADAVRRLTPARVEVSWGADRLAGAEEHTPPRAR
jgi:hypothetical protein